VNKISDFDYSDDELECGCAHCRAFREFEPEIDGSPYRWAPRAKKTGTTKTTNWWQNRPWKWVGLTQSCKELRAEYRPLWIKAFRVRLTVATFPLSVNTFCWMWEHKADRKEAEGRCIERATASDYIHNQMNKQVTNTVT